MFNFLTGFCHDEVSMFLNFGYLKQLALSIFRIKFLRIDYCAYIQPRWRTLPAKVLNAKSILAISLSQ
jgi:hypothetical protein